MEDVRLNFDDLLDNIESPQEPNEDEDLQNPEELQEPEELEEPESPEESEESEESKESEESETPTFEGNALYSFLQTRGIKDPTKLVFNNEDGSTEEVDFATLTPEEQLDILQQVTDPGLTEDEINTVNYLRRNQMSMAQAMEAYAQQKLDAYLNEHPKDVHQKSYAIDDYTDDDLYIVDLKKRYPDFTDEEILSKLDEAKKNETLFTKETEILRNAYKAQEDQAEAERVQLEQQQAEDLRNNLIAAASNFNEVQLDYTDDESDSLVIEDSDKQQMISYILDQDTDGKSQLVKDLENPDTLIELAWLRTQGAEVLSSVTKYWKETLAEARAENKKLQAQIDKLNKKNGSTVVVPKAPHVKEDTKAYSAWDNSGLI